MIFIKNDLVPPTTILLQAVIISVGPVSDSLVNGRVTRVTTCAKQISSIQHTLSDVFIVYHIDHGANRPVNN